MDLQLRTDANNSQFVLAGPQPAADSVPVVLANDASGVSTYTTTADAQTAIDVGPAPGSGEKSVLVEAVISTDTAMLITLQSETTPGSERVSFYLPVNGTVVFSPRSARKLSIADKKWQLLASVAGNIAISLITKSEA